MNRLIRIIAHQTDKGVHIDVLTADGAHSISHQITLESSAGAALAIKEAADTFFMQFAEVSIPEQLAIISRLEKQAKHLDALQTTQEGTA
jgi:hypothetical protein